MMVRIVPVVPATMVRIVVLMMVGIVVLVRHDKMVKVDEIECEW